MSACILHFRHGYEQKIKGKRLTDEIQFDALSVIPFSKKKSNIISLKIKARAHIDISPIVKMACKIWVIIARQSSH